MRYDLSGGAEVCGQVGIHLAEWRATVGYDRESIGHEVCAVPLYQTRRPHALSVIENPEVVDVEILALVSVVIEVDRYIVAVCGRILIGAGRDARALDEKIRRVTSVSAERKPPG